MSVIRHCERSEAIHLALLHDGLLRCARDDVVSSWPHQRIAVFGQQQNMSRRRPAPGSRPAMNSGRLPVSRSMVSTVLMQISNRAPCATRLSIRLRFSLSGFSRSMPATERHHLDRDLVGIIEFHQIVGDADHQPLLLRIVVRELQHDLVLGERLVLQRRLLGPERRTAPSTPRSRRRRTRATDRRYPEKSLMPVP